MDDRIRTEMGDTESGKKLRGFEADHAGAAMASLARDFLKGCVFAGREHLTIKEGAADFGDALRAAGFVREARDWVLWKNG